MPIDDENCYWFSMFTSFGKPVDKPPDARTASEGAPPARLCAANKNKRNNYGFNPDEQESLTYTGMGLDINVHEPWAVESMGRIQDRTQEHLGRTDVAISKYRRMLLAAIKNVEEGGEEELPDAPRRCRYRRHSRPDLH